MKIIEARVLMFFIREENNASGRCYETAEWRIVWRFCSRNAKSAGDIPGPADERTKSTRNIPGPTAGSGERGREEKSGRQRMDCYGGNHCISEVNRTDWGIDLLWRFLAVRAIIKSKMAVGAKVVLSIVVILAFLLLLVVFFIFSVYLSASING